ncbi:transporter substrate-binding domain-containing protein [Streptomyces sp. A7024]|uniref:Transporter substrate-binding domain-containing protein n=1 Tax=Streptomyces coryli TaxID=1128680 RepID=A0A6G4U0T0_9ACTN|nr:transporter substrate-binding domain-containing protein [Streptomyces coryli]NGN64887.1 transporter substrate-binding domain-containing protein [Streptomyces coryli]
MTIALIIVSCGGDEADETKERLTVATQKNLPGIAWVPPNSYKRSGFDHQLSQRIGEELGAKVNPLDIPIGDRVTVLTESDADLAIAAFSITADRMKKIDFAGPYITTYQGFLTGKQSPNIRSAHDLKGRRICAWADTTNLTPLRGLDVEVVQKEDATDCITAVTKNEVDAFSTDQLLLYGFADRYASKGLKVVPKLTVGAPQHYGIGLPKKDRARCKLIRDYLKRYVNGTEWITDIQANLPKVVQTLPDWQNHLKPTNAAIDARSCRDAPNP